MQPIVKVCKYIVILVVNSQSNLPEYGIRSHTNNK